MGQISKAAQSPRVGDADGGRRGRANSALPYDGKGNGGRIDFITRWVYKRGADFPAYCHSTLLKEMLDEANLDWMFAWRGFVSWRGGVAGAEERRYC
jgi:hypothetical protein